MQDWHLVCLTPRVMKTIASFPVCIGRSSNERFNTIVVDNSAVSRAQFLLKANSFGLVYAENLSTTNPTWLNGEKLTGSVRLSAAQSHVFSMGDVTIAVGTNMDDVCQTAIDYSVDLYLVEKNGREYGPLNEEELLQSCENGTFGPSDKAWLLKAPENVKSLGDIVDFSIDVVAVPDAADAGVSDASERQRYVSAEEMEFKPGENFLCPYCRTVSNLEDLLSVSVSPQLLDDPVLGEGEQQRFLPSRFTANGLAIDAEGGVCTEIACPHCHMALPKALLDMPQTVMSVIGAAGAGKSVFLASCVWQCRQMLGGMFKTLFMDLDPVANKWINAYEEKLFFQEDDETLQQIEKTELQSSSVCRSVMMNGDSVLLPLPSLFRVGRPGAADAQCLVVYDSAGEHFRAGADVQSSMVTLNMLNSDVLFFMFDPSADPRFRGMLNRGTGTAKNYAQRQDILLSEMSARIARHLGNVGGGKLKRPLVFGVSKADLLRDWLPLGESVYEKTEDGRLALDYDALRRVSGKTEQFLAGHAQEVVDTARNIAEEVWFVPVSALGHNPMREGVRPVDIKPHWAELPVVITLAEKGLVPTVGSKTAEGGAK